MNSPLARLCGRSPTDEATLRYLRAKAWLDQGVAVLRPEEIRDAWIRQAVVNEATRQYVRREQEVGR